MTQTDEVTKAIQVIAQMERTLVIQQHTTLSRSASRVYGAASTALGRVRKLYIAKGVLPPSAADPIALGDSQRGKTLAEVFAAMPPLPPGGAQ